MTTAPELPPIIASRYVPVRLIAKGGMGAVYEVEHARTGEHLALKVLLSSVASSAEERERFKREARAPARIKSEHVVRVTDADVAAELDGAPFLVMELLEGKDLEREAADCPPGPATVIDWLRQIARTLDKAHGLGIVHRDLKPQNLFLARSESRPPIVKILDFGIVKMTDESAGGTGPGQILGTPKYMSPEQASARSRVTSAADRYALGMVAYRLLTGQSYYTGDVLHILGQLLHAPLEPPSRRHPGFGAALDDWFLRACHRDPEARFATASEQVDALSAALGLPIDRTAEAYAGGGTESARRGFRRPVVVAALVAAGLGILLLATTVVARRLGTSGSLVTSPGTATSGPGVKTPALSSGPAALPAPALIPPSGTPPPAQVPTEQAAPGVTRPPAATGETRARHRRAPGTEPGDTASPVQPARAPDPYGDQH